jgi:predicted nucleic acid-binding protein
MVDASPLIYLAKLDALDVFEVAGHDPLITAEVERETSRPSLAYDHPDSLLIAEAIRTGALNRTELTADERRVAARLQEQAAGLHPGEAGVLAAAQARHEPVLLHERRALRLAQALGLDVWRPLRLLIVGTPDPELRRDRVLRFARLVDMPYSDVEAAINSLEEHRND